MNPAPSVRARWRLLLLLGLAFVWWLRWTTVQTSSGAEIQAGPERTGAVGAFALLLSWGYAATLLAAGRARGAGGMRVGAALTDAVVAGLAAVGIAQSLLATAAVGWAAFAALALLALLQVLVSGRSEALSN